MCRMKSAIILKDRVFIPDYDSHTQMLEELGIEDTKENAEKLFVRAELSPENNDVFSDIDTWKFKVDQDIVPEWFVKDYEAERMRNAVKEWAKVHIHIDEDNLKIDSGMHWIKGGKNINIYGSATVKYICDNATVENIYGSATVKYICGSATVENICDNATVENIYGSATVENIYGSATVKYICDNATVENIYGSATVENIYGNATVKKIYGNATVENIYGSATVITSGVYEWKNRDKAKLSDNATIKDKLNMYIIQSGDWTFVKVGEKK